MSGVELPGPSRIGPGRLIQFPVGYLFVAVAVVLVLIVAGYMVGYSRGRTAERLVLEEQFSGVDPEAIAAGNGLRPRDPLDPARSSAMDGANRTSVPSGPSSLAAPPSQGGWGPVVPEVDPRERGLSYFTLATTRKAGAVRLVEFCRKRGLETYVVPDNNAGLWRVIALPGFDPSERTGTRAEEMREKIYEIGDNWKGHEPGATNLRDANLLPW